MDDIDAVHVNEPGLLVVDISPGDEATANRPFSSSMPCGLPMDQEGRTACPAGRVFSAGCTRDSRTRRVARDGCPAVASASRMGHRRAFLPLCHPLLTEPRAWSSAARPRTGPGGGSRSVGSARLWGCAEEIHGVSSSRGSEWRSVFVDGPTGPSVGL
ncbi:DUF6207 family protein [Streptomyces sp. NBC_00306]|uniref:DUF6207 family protein n=1 Tax=Streptomyces sp. NBC_00306 TaxID=2975708 RepID=UPI003FA69B37